MLLSFGCAELLGIWALWKLSAGARRAWGISNNDSARVVSSAHVQTHNLVAYQLMREIGPGHRAGRRYRIFVTVHLQLRPASFAASAAHNRCCLHLQLVEWSEAIAL